MNGGTLDSEVVMFFYLISQLPLARQSVDAFLIQVFSAELGAPPPVTGQELVSQMLDKVSAIPDTGFLIKRIFC